MDTSLIGLLQFSDEKEYKVRYFTFSFNTYGRILFAFSVSVKENKKWLYWLMGTIFYKNTCRNERWRWRARQRQCWQSPHSQEVVRNCCRRPSSPWPGRARRRRRGPSTRSSRTRHHSWSASSLSSSSSRNAVALSVLKSRAADRNNLCPGHTWWARKDHFKA